MELYDKFFKCSGCERKCVVAIGKVDKEFQPTDCISDKTDTKWILLEENKCEVKQ